MTAPHVKSPDNHEVALLLPWYLNNTLTGRERQVVEEHLLVCADCRSELVMTEELRRRMQAMLAEAPSPSANLRAQVMRRLAEQRQSMLPRAGDGARTAAIHKPERPRIGEFLRRLLQPQWAPSAAALLILLQAGAISWMAVDSHRQPTADVQVTTRALTPPAAAKVRIVFNPAATETDIRAALLALGGRIVDGPDQDAEYVVQLPAETPVVISQRLRELRQRPGLVERIENAQ